LLGLVALLSALRRIIALSELLSALFQLSKSINPLTYLSSQSATTLPPSAKGKASAAQPSRRLNLEVLLQVTREGLDLVSTTADNIFLFSRLSLLPISRKNEAKADKIADFATLLSATVGLVHVARARNEIWSEGRQVRRGVLKLEEKLEESIFWEVQAEDSTPDAEKKLEDVKSEERRIKESLRRERRKLKGLREELDELWWERLRLSAEGVFAGPSAIFFPHPM
jgi:hypothetical protein